MNKQASSVSLVAALATTLTLISTTAMAGKSPPPPPPPDPCLSVTAATFPSFVFKRTVTSQTRGVITKTYLALLADATGKCEKQLTATPSESAVNMRYDGQTALLVTVANNQQLAGATWDISFPSGAPTVTPLSNGFSTSPPMLDLVDLTPPSDMTQQGWVLSAFSEPAVSPDGTLLLFRVSYRNATPGQIVLTHWTCPFNLPLVSTTNPIPSINKPMCRQVHRASDNQGSSASWSATDNNTIYVAEPAADQTESSARNSLWRLRLTTTPVEHQEILRSDTANFLEVANAKAALINGQELLAVHESNFNTDSFCAVVLVIDPADCSLGSCSTVLNGPAGTSARTVTWLPDGRVAAQGQLPPNRQGRCGDAGTIVAFPTNGNSVTTLTQGDKPDGAGGG